MTALAIETSTQLVVPLSLEPTLHARGEWFRDSLHLALEQGLYEPPHVTVFREAGGFALSLAEVRQLREHLGTLLDAAVTS